MLKQVNRGNLVGMVIRQVKFRYIGQQILIPDAIDVDPARPRPVTRP
jgi:hypothetical protein